MDGSKTDDRLRRVLCDERRRTILRCLEEHRVLTLADLADEIAVAERGETIDDISPDAVRSIYIELYHRHVPKLAAVDLVEYDQEQDLVGITDRGVEVDPFTDPLLEEPRS